MRCVWCGEETPEGSAYCESCGHELEEARAVSEPEESQDVPLGKHAAAGQAAPGFPYAEPLEAGEAASGGALFEISEGVLEDILANDVVTSVDAIAVSSEDEPLVAPPSSPVQPELSRGRIAIVAIIAVLFSAAVILLVWAIVMRVLGA